MLCQSNWCAAHCGASRIAAHRTYMGSCRKNDWQFSNPRIDTAGLSPKVSIQHIKLALVNRWGNKPAFNDTILHDW